MSASQFDWAKNIPCRNIQIHGFCKFEHKGCSYNHDMAQKTNPSTSSPGLPSTTTANSSLKPVSPGANLSSLSSLPIKSPSTQTINLNTNLTPISSSKVPVFKPTLLKTQSNSSLLVKSNSINDINSSPASNKKFSMDSPAFTPTSLNKFSALSPSLDHIPTFVPSGNSTDSKSLEATTIASALKEAMNANEVTDTLSSSDTTSATTNSITMPNNKSESLPTINDFSSVRSTLTKTNSFNPATAPVFTPNSVVTNPTSNIVSSSYLPNHETGEELFYQNTSLYPVNFLLYAPPPPPHIELNKQPNERTVDDLFIDRKLREYLQQKNEESLKSISNNELDLPSHVGIYHSLYPIDHNFEYTTKSFGYTSIVYKCMSNEDGKLYTMRRLQNVPISSPSVLKSIKKWKRVECANIVKVYDVFTTRAFNDNSLILIYDYYPMSMTLLENHFMSFPGKNPDLITEDCLWNYTIQLLNAIAEVNKANLSIGSLDSSKIIITNKGRIRLSALGINDVLQDVKKKLASENSLDNLSKNESDDNESDLLHLGKLLLFLAKSTTFITNAEDPAEIIMQLKFTETFKNMLLYLFDKDATIEKFQELVAPMILKITNGLQNSCDNMESTLMTELENARLIRLFAKLDFISERPEMVKDGSWSETGERYPIKLFKDYVFHQVDDNGKPVVDLTHVINCLNKLDAGVEENILLVSPDEMTCLIMSYKDLKELINKSFLSLLGKE